MTSSLLWVAIALPFFGFTALIVTGRRLRKRFVPVIGAGTIGISAVLLILVAAGFLATLLERHSVSVPLLSWLVVGNLTVKFTVYLDALSLLMTLVITTVAFFILLYSSDFMKNEEYCHRFFAYMDLFVGFMLVLVLSDNLPFLYIGWEGVGLCSYLLIGFWYKVPENDTAARKSFIVTRVGDTAFLIGILLVFTRLGTLNIQGAMSTAAANWKVGSGIAVAVSALILTGALSKSSQVPLQVWLPDAMAGPTPVSALIHSSTMVIAGVYLIARTNGFFRLAPAVQLAVAIIGAATLLMSGFSGLTQEDIKRVLAYSTISQIGYMFLGLGVGAWPAAIFHFMSHAFFKALLFLSAGVIVLAMNHERSMYKMGGMRKQFPFVFWAFLIGASSLSAVPFITSGFYSKDWILREAWMSPYGSHWLWVAGVLGVILTTLYSFRMVFLVFFGEQKTKLDYKPGFRMVIPMVVFSLFALGGGLFQMPSLLGRVTVMNSLLKTAIPMNYSASLPAGSPAGIGLILLLVPSALTLISIYVAYLLYLRRPLPAPQTWPAVFASIRRYFYSDWGFDRLYDAVFVRPYNVLSRLNREDLFSCIYTGLAAVNRGMHGLLSGTQSGRLRWYVLGVFIGSLISIFLVVIL